jgi:hypothetical protein
MFMEDYNDEEDTFDLSNLPSYYAQKLNGFLREASKQGHLTCIDVLVSKGADVNYVDKQDKTTVLQAAILNGHNNIIEYLYNKSNEKTRRTAHSYARDKLKKLEDALRIFQEPNGEVELISAVQPTHAKAPEVGHVPDKGKQKEGTEEVKSVRIEKESQTDKVFREEMQVDAEEYLELQANHKELKKDYNILHREYNALEIDFEDLQKRYNLYKSETDESIFQLKHQVERLNNELALEKEHNEETEDVLDNLGKELSQKMREITTVKIERDTERRAKEIAKRILSLDNNTTLSPSGLNVDIPETAKSENSRNRIDLSFGTNKLVPNKVKQEGSKDDIEIHIEDRVKYRVRRLVKRWEERTFSKDDISQS